MDLLLNPSKSSKFGQNQKISVKIGLTELMTVTKFVSQNKWSKKKMGLKYHYCKTFCPTKSIIVKDFVSQIVLL